jgi:hypothetical protein
MISKNDIYFLVDTNEFVSLLNIARVCSDEDLIPQGGIATEPACGEALSSIPGSWMRISYFYNSPI